MLEESEERRERSSNTGHFLNNEFYIAIMDEDLGRIEDMSKKYGSNFLIKQQGGTPREVFWKGPATLPLHLATSYRRVKSMQSLLSTGADPEMRDQLGRTTLHLVIAGCPSILTTWPKPDSKFQTAVLGVRRQAEACLRLLCEHGVNINVKVEGSRQTALHLAVRYMAPSAVQILASHGADINAVDSSGMTPLHMAAGILHKDIMTSLIKEGADMNMGVEHSGNTPLHLAAVAMAMKLTKIPEDECCISELLEQGAEANVANKAGMTPLHEVCCMGHEELVDLLLSYGADVNKLTRAGESCLFLFLNRRTNVRNSTLLAKLLSLTSTLTIYDRDGHLPSTLTLPWFSKQRDQLLKLTQQPRRLQDICKSHVYLKHGRRKTEELRKILPKKLYDFVFNYWEKGIFFVADGVQDSLNNFRDVSLS